MGITIKGIGILALSVLLTAFSLTLSADENVPRIGQEELLSIIDNPTVAILDARIVKDWRKSDGKIKGAVRVDPHDVSSWIGNYSKGQKIVVYCSWKNEATSASVARRMIELGYTNVSVLKGGWHDWVRAGFPTEPK